MNKRETRIEAVFHEALALDSDTRAAFVQQQCDDAAMQQEVQALLQANEQASQFLHQPHLHPAQPDDDELEYASSLIGKRIGSYEIKQTLGVGGMGAVFEAQQERPRRSVALKLMRQSMVSRAAVKRFHFEVEVLASLHHPNIAHVYEAGVHDDGTGGVPYFAMEHVINALPITHYARQKQLSIAARLKLFILACDAIHHGHQKGILHRDIKPQNVLVNSAGELKIIDFGVAKATNVDLAVTTQQSEYNQFVGTIQYMSPEQCAGNAVEVDTRCDVYSLGVVLYELLAEKPPYDTSGMTLLDATRTICDDTPPPLGMRNRSLRGSLETVVHTAIAKEPTRRYQSAAALADDIRRHLAGEPIAARPPSRWQKLTRWVGKRPIATTAGLCLSIICISLLATWLSVWYLALRPERIELAHDRSHARLLSTAGHELHRWGGDAESIRSAVLIPTDDRRQIALIGYGPSDANEYPGAVVAYDATGDLSEPLWISQLDWDDLPGSLQDRGATPSQFSTSTIQHVNVFEDHPAPQCIVCRVFTPYSQSVIRVYDTHGEVLYQAWADCTICQGLHWLSSPQIMVAAGKNAYVYWEDRDHPSAERASERFPHPSVVFAFKPEYGMRSTKWISLEPMNEPTIDPLWYRCLLPPEKAGPFKVRLGDPQQFHPEHFVEFIAMLPDTPFASIKIPLDAQGNEVPGARVVQDPLRDNPDVDSLYLGDLPPILPDAMPE